MKRIKPILISIHAILFICVQLSLLSSCNNKKKHEADTLFHLVDPDSSGIHFANIITTSDSLNLFTFEYIYNGGGVGIGDFNNDGLQDIFFTGNMVPSRLYINKGNFQFEDVTKNSGIGFNGWPFGVAVTDVDGDGLQDIYISMGGLGNKDIFPNKLFINQGFDKNNLPHFKEMAQEYGVADPGQSIQAAFFDYDHDGDLDMYLLTGGGFEKSPIVPHPISKDGSGRNTDRLYRNDYDKKLGHPVFTNVSNMAGILEEGYGLGISLLDINDDGWLDVYVTNDYLSNDLLYVNNKNGTFSEMSAQYFNHTSHFAMGNDVGDINNDGLMDVIAVDMLPDKHYQRTLMFGPNQYDKFYYSVQQGYNYQYMRNTLQLNMGKGKFSEIGQLSGIYKTSWSWAPLFADLDNDGYQDIFITNGFGKDVTDLDFVKFRSDIENSNLGKKKKFDLLLDSLSAHPSIKTHPYAYKNNGGITFKDMSEQWGFNNSIFSNGCAYADLDNDGDLDLVTNNIDETAHLYRNTLYETALKRTVNYLSLKLMGPPLNTSAIGTKVNIHYNNKIQTRLQSAVRGFESTVENIIHFGLGKEAVVDTLQVLWPDGRQSILSNIRANHLLTIDYKESQAQDLQKKSTIHLSLFNEISPSALNIQYLNKKNDFNDFNYERLLPKKYSNSGQGIAVGDVNDDGLEDLFIGGAFQQTGQIFTQNTTGTFSMHPLNTYSDGCEDKGALFFDADNDGDLDLYVVSGGNEFSAGNKKYQDRLYKNDGNGNFVKDSTALPVMISSGSCVVAADYDQDGDLDLFVGGHVVPGLYPQTPKSYLLRNDNDKFTDVTDVIAPSLRNSGMVTSALWTDIDNDSKPDLILVGEWMPVTVFKNQGNRFANLTAADGLLDTEGWWQGLVAGDFDNDGDMDYIAGNWGLNNPYNVSATEPMRICYKDFDRNGSIDPVICCYEDGVNYPIAPWDYLVDQIPSLRKIIPSYASYAALSMDKLLSKLDTAGMQTLVCKTLHSAYIENLGNGKFTVRNLPIEAQFAPLFGMIATDVNHDGNLDLIGVGNFYGTDVIIGRYDACGGLILSGNGRGDFKQVSLNESGFMVNRDAKAISRIESGKKGSLVLVTQNSDSMKVFEDKTVKGLKRIYPNQNEIYALLNFKNGGKRKTELSFGNSYLSQSSRSVIITPDIKSIELYNNKGTISRSFNF